MKTPEYHKTRTKTHIGGWRRKYIPPPFDPRSLKPGDVFEWKPPPNHETEDRAAMLGIIIGIILVLATEGFLIFIWLTLRSIS